MAEWKAPRPKPGETLDDYTERLVSSLEDHVNGKKPKINTYSRFNPGDRIVIVNHPDPEYNGAIAVVKHYHPELPYSLSVDLERPIYGMTSKDILLDESEARNL